MINQPRKNPRGNRRDLKKSLQNKSKSKTKLVNRKNKSLTEREISEVTLRRLHILGRQKFGSSPYSQHFQRWLSNVESVITEFDLNLSTGVDDQLTEECSEILSVIRQQLENIKLKESTIDQEIKYLSECRSLLQQIDADYVKAEKARRSQKNRTVKSLNNEINCLRKELENVIRIKTGFFRGISKKERERKELEILQEINAKQTELELLILNFSSGQKMFREEFETKREPVLEQIKRFRKMVRELEMDCSLEERWFTCEALIDSVNTFLQRKAAKSNDA